MRPVLVVIGGLPATGKSTIAAALAAQTVTPYVRVDRIEQAIVAWSALVHPVGPVGYAVAHQLALEQLQLGLDVIVECVNPVAVTRDAWPETARAAGAAVVEIEVICSDEVEHRRRVQNRGSDVDGLVKPTWAEIAAREYEPWSRTPVRVDSATTSVAAAVQRITVAVAAARYLAAYDLQLRTARTAAALEVTALGPLLLLTLERGQGFVTYRDLDGVSPEDLKPLVVSALDHFRRDATIERVDWKTCSHDRVPGLVDVLLELGFTVGSAESIMVGESRRLAVRVDLPPGVTLRRITVREDVAAMEEMQGEVFGDPDWPRRVEVMMRRLAVDDGMELWVAEADGRVVTAGRIEPVAGTDFADLCGGATRPEWRGLGIYRALTAARANAALEQGKTLLHSSSTEFSRPILERSGLIRVSGNTTYSWLPPHFSASLPTDMNTPRPR